ncbi:IS1595 family transposase [Chryseobacterium pennae]|uniref:IS1595 family transposase n=1 Tax=Chryseobacterium pennae TaxID=2258962 RepID=A0A3D9CEK9_9FLAO|nr:IS1595 family transposase [Chryseobacterium pennae]REC63922.1 IS1595 family transposase [Chryseobacterium pennae]
MSTTNLHKNTFFKSIIDLIDNLNTDNDCMEYLEKIRWNGEPECPHCGSKSDKHYRLNKKNFKGLYKCKDCRNRFTVTVGTMFESSHISLRKWFTAIWLFASHKKGISSVQLHKDLHITQKTAWFMLSRIRYNFNQDHIVVFDSDTQADETYVGGEARKMNNQHVNTQGRSLKIKTPVFGLISNGTVFTKVIPNAKGKTLKSIISSRVLKGTTLITDGWRGYKGLHEDYRHEVVEHSKGTYKRGEFHTNGIEGFWSILKRGLIGIYHFCSVKHLEKYCNEFSFRFNTREMTDGQRFVEVLKIINTRLTYNNLKNTISVIKT